MRAWWIVGIAGMLGCAGGEDTGTTKDPVGSGDTGPEPIEQAAVCQQWLDCLGATDPGSVSIKQGQYGADGTCWVDAETAAQCEIDCQAALSVLNDVHPDEPLCDDGLPDNADDVAGRWQYTTVATEGTCSGGRDAPVLEEYRVIYDAPEPDILEAEVYSTVDGATITYDLACTFDGVTIACEAVSAYGGALMTSFTGTYDGTTILADAVYDLTYDETTACPMTYSLTGERY